MSTEARQRIIIAGGSGYLGRNLARHLAPLGYQIQILTRSASSRPTEFDQIAWDARTPGEWIRALDGAAGLVNLAGRSVDCIKTPDHCDEILRSRVESTRALGMALRSVNRPPRVWVQMSTAHLYGDSVEITCDEDAAPGYGLAPFVAREWEAAFKDAQLPGIRGVILRTSFVLGRGGGALRRLEALARWGLGGTIASGRQGISWIHESDMNRLFEWSLRDDAASGAYIASAPHPVSNREFMAELRRAVGARVGLPAAEWMIRIAAPLILRTDPELALYGRYVVSRRLHEAGFEFRFPQLRDALAELFARR